MKSPMLLALLMAGAAALAVVDARAQTPPAAKAAPTRPAAARPAWNELTAAQREALAPLAGEWEKLDRDQKRKWLEVAEKFPQLSDDGKERLHARMAEYARLTPEQRRTARANFQRAYELPMEQRQSLLQQYQQLPEEKKQELADKARKSADVRRPTPTPGKKSQPTAPERTAN
ncbi:MAG: DUF3106 domain-containing protein [Burkholderiaceae bacterium]|nr:DUF3106 domain-containing protein [Burkholderiaceae bacterium]